MAYRRVANLIRQILLHFNVSNFGSVMDQEVLKEKRGGRESSMRWGREGGKGKDSNKESV